MRASDVFPPATLRAADIAGRMPILTIDKVTVWDFDGERKPLIHFRAPCAKALVCNVTNWHAIVKATGADDSDAWTGKQIRLHVATVEYQGQMVPAIRVGPVRTAADGLDEDIDDEAIPY